VIRKTFKNLKGLFKNGKAVAVLGIAGILLIGVSSVFPQKEKPQKSEISTDTYYEEYRETLEKQIKDIVVGLTGEKKTKVVITLETGVRYSYASETEENTNDTKNEGKTDTAVKSKKNYITVKNENGGEEALIVTDYMPKIRGVAVVCKAAEDQNVRDSITNTVTAALGISENKIYVAPPV
jgi:stage III sporulation protein AG